MQSKLKTVAYDDIIKVLGIIYFVAVRRSRGNREYLNIVRQYVGGGGLWLWETEDAFIPQEKNTNNISKIIC